MNRFEQMRLPLVVLGGMVGTFAAVATLAHTTPAIQNYLAGELERYRTTNGMYMYDAGHVDDGDYVLMEQLPNDDFSRGGVYFIGASEMKTSLMNWTLSPQEQALIHNYSIGDFRHHEVREYVRMLVNEFGLLQAGPERTTIFLGLSYQMTRNKDIAKPIDRYVEFLFERHGAYSYDNGVVHRLDQSPFDRFLREQRDMANRFLRATLFPNSRVKPEPQADVWKRAHLLGVMDGDWQEEMRVETAAFMATVDDLQALGVNVVAILPPNGSWQHELPYDAAYRALVLPELASRGVRVVDQGDLLADDEFADATHGRYVGNLKLHAAYHALALEALREMNITP